jgi:uncharacterized membrane protein
MSEEVIVIEDEKMKSSRSLTQAVYVLLALSYFTGITGIVAIIINYIKREEVAGTWLESHFTWQIRTFWYGLLWAIIGLITLMILIGGVILFANFCWVTYRIVKGWLNLHDSKPMPL